MSEIALPEMLVKQGTFSRREYSSTMSETYHMTAPQISYDLSKRLDSGELVRSGWGLYSKAGNKSQYHYRYQKVAEDIVSIINSNYIDLDFRVFELVQLNEFINHLIGRNTAIVYVENDFTDQVFNTLFEAYPGKVMLKPGVDEFYRYFQDDQIVVCRLISEAPRGLKRNWEIRLEQIIVDIIADRFVSRIVPDEEKASVIRGASESYIIDKNTMFRYARRKGAEKKVKQILTASRRDSTYDNE